MVLVLARKRREGKKPIIKHADVTPQSGILREGRARWVRTLRGPCGDWVYTEGDGCGRGTVDVCFRDNEACDAIRVYGMEGREGSRWKEKRG